MIADMIHPHCHGWAYKTALSVREAFGIHGIPTDEDIERVVDGLQLRVVERKITGQPDALLADDIIILRPGLSREERRWGIVHEIGHYLGHAGCQLEIPKWLRWRQERQADVFTGFFLVVLTMVGQLHSAYEVAELCDVPMDRVIHWVGWLAS